MRQKHSVAQNLPYPVLNQIIEYAADFHSMSQVNSIYLARPRISPYLQLTQVCHSWRSTMLQTLCRDYLLILSTSESCDIRGYRLWPVNEKCGRYPLDHFVKTVRLVIDYCMARSGYLLEKLMSEPYRDLVFSSATTLKLVFADCLECDFVEKHEDTEMAAKYVTAIRKMVPNFENIVVESKSNHTGLDGRVGSAYQVLPGLFGQAKSRMFSMFDSAFMEYVDIPRCSNVTHLAFGGDIEDERIVQLVQANAQTLRILEMPHILNGNVAELLQSEDGSDQVFPELQKLHLRRKALGQTPRRVETTAAVVFPSLKWLCIDMSYPLDDDTFLRGNSDTLEYLEMQIDALCVDMLRRCNAFQAKRFKRLKHLKLRPVETQNGRDMDNELTSANLPMFLQGISAMPQRLCIDGFNALDEVIESTGHLPSMLNLRVLNIPDTRLTLSQIPDLLRGLPAIEELGIGYAADLGPAFSQVSTTDLPQLISTRYSPLAPHLWKLNQRFDEDEISLETFAEYAVMMKIMCPSLTHIATTPDHVQRVYRDTVKDEMSKPYLQGHIRELSVLLRVIPKVGIRLV